jgi:hypothetical protein
MLTAGHRDSLARDGYAVVPGLVPERLLKAPTDVICSCVNADLDRADTWYRHEPLEWSVVPVHHAQAFWDVRQWRAVHETFAEMWGTEKLWVTMDRGIFKVPQSDAHPDHVDGSVLHWDLDPRAPGSSTYQGMLFLTDVAHGEGTVECVPSIFRDLDRYLHAHSGPVLNVPVDLAGHDVVEVPARRGDLVIWNARLPHQGGRNRGGRPRVSLAVTMHPEGTDADRQDRIECWRESAPRLGGVAGRVGSTLSPVNRPCSPRSAVGSSEWIVGHSISTDICPLDDSSRRE